MKPLPPKSFKQRYPFRLATTSFIYPDDYAPNVRRLGPFFDEIELLFFERAQVPSPRTIRELAALSREQDVGYNVHLPSDVSIGQANRRQREGAVNDLLGFCERVAPLAPSTLTLHVPCAAPCGSPQDRRPWAEAVQRSLSRLASAIGDPARISVETLDYPLEWLEDVIADLGLSICMDTGHLLGRGQDPGLFFDRFESKISIIHLHGVDHGKDHQPPARLPEQAAEGVRSLLAGFKGVVSLEVFSLEALIASLHWMEDNVPT
jgi:sugar phosphate isomerase/epimerase